MVSTFIAIISLVFAVFTFLFFDVRIKKQEQVINEYVISGYKEAAREKLRANLSLSTYWKDKDTLRLVVRNDGPSDAFNVMVVGMDRDCYLFRDSAASAPIETLYSGDSEEFDLQVYSDMPQKTRVQVNWIDDSKEMRTKKVILSIH